MFFISAGEFDIVERRYSAVGTYDTNPLYASAVSFASAMSVMIGWKALLDDTGTLILFCPYVMGWAVPSLLTGIKLLMNTIEATGDHNVPVEI